MKWPFACGGYHMQTQSTGFVTTEKSGPAQISVPSVGLACIQHTHARFQFTALNIQHQYSFSPVFGFMAKYFLMHYFYLLYYKYMPSSCHCPLVSRLRLIFFLPLFFKKNLDKSNNQWFSLARACRVLKDLLGNCIYFLAYSSFPFQRPLCDHWCWTEDL